MMILTGNAYYTNMKFNGNCILRCLHKKEKKTEFNRKVKYKVHENLKT